MKIELLEMGDEGDWECEIVHEDTSTTSFQATMETIPKSGNIPSQGPGIEEGNIPAAVGPGTTTFSTMGYQHQEHLDTTFGSPFASTPSATNTGTNHQSY